MNQRAPIYDEPPVTLAEWEGSRPDAYRDALVTVLRDLLDTPDDAADVMHYVLTGDCRTNAVRDVRGAMGAELAAAVNPGLVRDVREARR